MCRAESLLLVAAILCWAECSGLHMYPEIFDPAKFLQRPLPLKSVQSRAAPEVELYTDGGFKDGEVGFVRSSSESGKGGYRHKENFHKKDGNKYGHERQTGFGESKRTEDELGKEQGRVTVDTHHYRPEPTYEVIEEVQSDLENPDKNKKYGLAPSKDKKKPTEMKPKSAKSSRQTAPAKRRSNQKKNHSGYESIVYHENERDSSEHGYGKKKAAGKIPDEKKPAKQIAHDEGDAFEGEDGLDSAERHTGDEYSDSESDGGRDSDFSDNYDSLRFDSDFERSFGSEEREDDSEDGRQAGKKEDDYDEQEDDDEEDDGASQDKYRGDEYDDEEDESDGSEKGDDDRQYEYASEADGDAADY
uniref:Uncharacterized protein n=1 Tax=Anopheles epiroticus TaxID=199890 RepID=A0A182P1V7_9DIPT